MDDFTIEPNYRVVMKQLEGPYGPGLKFIGRLAQKWCIGNGLDVGASAFSDLGGYPGAIPIDPSIGTGTATAIDVRDHTQDYIFSSHTLEHVPDPEAAVREFYRVLKFGGVVFLYLPFPGHPGWDPLICETARGIHLWQPSPTSVPRLLALNGFRIIYAEQHPDHYGGFVTIGRKV